MRNRKAGWLAVVLIVGGMLTACTSEPNAQATAQSTTPSEPSFVAASYVDGTAGGLQARTEGALQAEDGCLYVQTADDRVLPVFPASAVSADGQTVTVSGAEYSDGDSIVLSGGMTAVASGFTIPSGCDTADVWVVSTQ